MTKVRFGGLDMVQPNAIEPTKMPRTAVIPVVRDSRSGYLNAAPYSGGVTSLQPLQLLFGVKSPQAIEAFRRSDEFCVAIPNKHQIDAMWTMALEVPHGLNEIEIAGWHPLPSRFIKTPGIEECMLNLECKKVALFQLPPPWRAVVVGEVVGVTIESKLLEMTRSQVVNLYPVHESGSHPETGLYSPSVLSGELIPGAEPLPEGHAGEGKTTVGVEELYRPENDLVLMNAVFPMPTYILMTRGEDGQVDAQVICGGSLQSSEPAVQIPVLKDSPAYQNIKRTGEYVVSIPDRSLIENVERLEHDPTDLEAAGFSLLRAHVVDVQGIAECPVSMDCRAVILEDVPGTDYALLIGRKVGATLDEEVAARLDMDAYPLGDRLAFTNRLYASFIYAVMDRHMTRKWAFHDEHMISVRELPSWGSRYTGGWWGPGPALAFWLIELCQEGLIDKHEYYKIGYAVRLWNNGKGIPHLAEFCDAEMMAALRERLTRLFHLMAWAHRDYHQWELAHRFLATFPDPPRDHHAGPVFHTAWHGRM